MKVLYIGHSSLLFGAGRAMYNMIVPLKMSFGVQPFVVLPSKGALYEKLEKEGIPVMELKIPQFVYPPIDTLRDVILFPYRLARLILTIHQTNRKVKEIITTIKPDIVHTNVGVIHSGYYIAKKNKIPHVWHVREFQDLDFDYYPYPSKNELKRKFSSTYNYNIAISKAIENYWGLEKNTRVIYDGVLDSHSIPPICYKKDNYFIYVGSLHKGKGIYEAVEAFNKFCLSNKEIRFLIAGSGPEYENLKMIISANKRIELLGFRTDIPKLMSRAIALIVPSKSEGFGFIVVEAMSNGCLVIGHNTAAIKEQLDNGLLETGREIGLRYTTEDELVCAMKNALIQTRNNPERILPLAQEFVYKKYTNNLHARQVFNYYNYILSIWEKQE